MKIQIEFEVGQNDWNLIDQLVVMVLRHIKKDLLDYSHTWTHKDDKRYGKRHLKAVNDLLDYYGIKDGDSD